MICVPVIGQTFRSALNQIRKANASSADLIELRIDLLNSETRKELGELINAAKKPVIATVRSKKEGGKLTGRNQTNLLIQAIDFGAEFIDIEMNSSKKETKKLIDYAKKKKAKIILSKHYSKALSRKELEKELIKAKKIKGIDLIKLIPTAERIEDNIETLNFLIHNNRKNNLISFCIGEKGVISRVLCLKAGSRICFASLAKGKESAKGQLSLKELKKKMDEKNFAVIGNPIKHSLSPLMHEAGFKAKGIKANYYAFEIQKNELKKTVNVLKLFNGFNVTMPFKEKIIPLLDSIDKNAEKINAVNTVAIKNKKLTGYNTDSIGAINALKKKTKLRGKKVLLFGAGGAAKAIIVGLKKEKAETVVINRTKNKALALKKKFKVQVKKLNEINSNEFDILINATSTGMKPKQNEMICPESFLRKGLVVIDLVYEPIETKLLKEAKKKRCTTINGLEMLLLQGTEAFRIFTNKQAPLNEMRKALMRGI
ncbi:MAG: shikimate dehydrogenase [Candidatus Diapherotrites archaeon]